MIRAFVQRDFYRRNAGGWSTVTGVLRSSLISEMNELALMETREACIVVNWSEELIAVVLACFRRGENELHFIGVVEEEEKFTVPLSINRSGRLDDNVSCRRGRELRMLRSRNLREILQRTRSLSSESFHLRDE